MVRVQYEAVYAADVAFVMGALVDESFLAAYAEEIGAIAWEIAVDRLDDSIRSRLRLTVPTQGLPAIFKRLVTPTVDVIETRRWPAGQGGSDRYGVVAVDAAVGRQAARVRGSMQLAPVAAGTRFSMSADITVIGLVIASLAETMVKELIVWVLGDQTKVMNLWTSG